MTSSPVIDTAPADRGTERRPTSVEAPRRRGRRRPRVHPLVILGVILLVGLVVRALGVAWGLPFHLHPDEWVIFEGAVDMAKRNSFEPQLFFRPDHVEMKLSYIAYAAYAALRHAPVEVLAAADLTPFVAISRSITVVLGVATIALAYVVGRRFGTAVGLVAAALFALLPTFVEHSHFATPDVPLTLTVLVVVWGAMRYLSAPTWPNLLIMSAGVALSIGIKYPGAIGASMIAIVVIIAAVRSRTPLQIVTRGAGSIGAVVVLLFLISPVLFTNVSGVVAAIRNESRTTHLGADGLGWAGNLAFYVDSFAQSGGYILVVFALIGAVWAIRRRSLEAVPLTIGAIYWIALSSVPLHWGRWALPMYVTPLLFAAIGFVVAARFLWTHQGRWVVALRAGFSVVVALALASLSIGAAAWTARYASSDTRVVALDAFAEYGPTARNTVAEGYTSIEPEAPRGIFRDFVIEDGTLVLAEGVEDRDEKRYVMLSSGIYGRYQDDDRYAEEQEFYRLLNEQFEVLETVDPGPFFSPSPIEPLNVMRALEYLVGVGSHGAPGPRIVLYEIPASAQ